MKPLIVAIGGLVAGAGALLLKKGSNQEENTSQQNPSGSEVNAEIDKPKPTTSSHRQTQYNNRRSKFGGFGKAVAKVNSTPSNLFRSSQTGSGRTSRPLRTTLGRIRTIGNPRPSSTSKPAPRMVFKSPQPSSRNRFSQFR